MNDAPGKEDLEGVDFSLVKSLDLLRNVGGGDAELFGQTFFETFTTTSSDDRAVELLPGGAQTEVIEEDLIEQVVVVLTGVHENVLDTRGFI